MTYFSFYIVEEIQAEAKDDGRQVTEHISDGVIRNIGHSHPDAGVVVANAGVGENFGYFDRLNRTFHCGKSGTAA
jgi:hypothetical protein